jgi:alkylation response protein AidB-like acyl-CoA dehydrogenase
VLRSLPVLCAWQVGSCEAVFELARQYVDERVAFGRTIGMFQRVQDHVIDIVNALDGARWATYFALWQLEHEPDPVAAIHVAKAATADAHYRACTSAHEVHAGIGCDLQYPLAAHTFASRSLAGYLGDAAWHRRRLADVLGLPE